MSEGLVMVAVMMVGYSAGLLVGWWLRGQHVKYSK